MRTGQWGARGSFVSGSGWRSRVSLRRAQASGLRPCAHGRSDVKNLLLRMTARGDGPDPLHAIVASTVDLIVLVHRWIAVRDDQLQLVAHLVGLGGRFVPNRPELV